MTLPLTPIAPAQNIMVRKITSPDTRTPDWPLNTRIKLTSTYKTSIRTPGPRMPSRQSLKKPGSGKLPHSPFDSGEPGDVRKDRRKKTGFWPWKHYDLGIDSCGHTTTPGHMTIHSRSPASLSPNQARNSSANEPVQRKMKLARPVLIKRCSPVGQPTSQQTN